MFGNVTGAYLWAWTSVGAAVEVLLLILPAALGLKSTIDAGLSRVFFSWTLHAIVYFWLMGALVGGAYAAGVAPADIQALVRKTDWIGIFDDTAGRESVDLRRKSMDDRYYSGLEFGVSREGLKFREGAVSGEKLKLFFNELVRSDLGDRPIEELTLPLAIIATDIGTGERVAIRSGNLTSAMRASMLTDTKSIGATRMPAIPPSTAL